SAEAPVAPKAGKIADQEELSAQTLDGLAERLVLDRGHVDAFSVSFDGSNVFLSVNEDVTGRHVQREPSDVLFHVKPSALTDVTKRIEGIETEGFALPQSQRDDLLWPGWNSMPVTQAADTAQVEIQIDEVSGPGSVFLWQDSLSGEPQPVASSGLRLGAGAVISQEEPAHVHANWLFTDEGIYQMVARARVIVDERTWESDPKTFTWAVGALVANENDRRGDESDSKSMGEAPSAGSHNASDLEQNDPVQGATFEHADASATKPGEAGANPTEAPKEQTTTGQTLGSSANPQEQCIPTEITVPAAGRASGSHTISANTHVHPNWVFAAPGTYRVSLTQTAVTKTGKQLNATDTLTFHVGGNGGNATSGHFDVGAAVESGNLVMRVKDDRSQPPVWRKPSELVFGVSDAAKISAPEGIDFVAKPGEPVWIIGATQMKGVPWVGANTQHPSLAKHTTGTVTWTVNAVEGPGAMAVFESGSFGQVVGSRWFSASGDGAAKVFVGKTASGEDCELSAEQIAEIERAGGVVAGSLARTGTDDVLLWLGAAASLLMAGMLLLNVARPNSRQDS
ncbi:MAG: choice-of-anchor M domain-containing protein, partial [Actinomycetaceae bacterium]|nr:choice-of-anchor M domain-containing protein [Actinomycetaceae bacterium]